MIPKRLSRRAAYENEWVSLYLDRVDYGDGTIIDPYHVIHFDQPSVAMIIENEQEEILLIRSNRYVTQTEEWEIPAGRVERGEAAANAALRETMEETGYTLTVPELVYEYYPIYGISDKRFLIYRAKAMQREGVPNPQEVSAVRWVSKVKLREMIAKQEIRCGLSLTGLLLALF